MSNIDMSEAVRMLAEHHGISVDALLQVLVEALATAYKKRPGAADEVIVEVNPENLDMKFTAYDVGGQTIDGQRSYQNLVVERGGVQVDDVVVRVGRG